MFEIEYFGVDLITPWTDAKFIGTVDKYLSTYDKIHYTISVCLMLLADELFFFKLKSMITNKVIQRIPLRLFQDINFFINSARYAGSTKCISRKIAKNAKLKHMLKDCCYQIDNSLYMIRL